jgi:hypothetical protein
VIQPDNVHLRTATELLEQILARGRISAIRHHPAAQAARTAQLAGGAVRLGAATARYVDAIHVAAKHLAGPQAAA